MNGSSNLSKQFYSKFHLEEYESFLQFKSSPPPQSKPAKLKLYKLKHKSEPKKRKPSIVQKEYFKPPEIQGVPSPQITLNTAKNLKKFKYLEKRKTTILNVKDYLKYKRSFNHYKKTFTNLGGNRRSKFQAKKKISFSLSRKNPVTQDLRNSNIKKRASIISGCTDPKDNLSMKTGRRRLTQNQNPNFKTEKPLLKKRKVSKNPSLNLSHKPRFKSCDFISNLEMSKRLKQLSIGNRTFIRRNRQKKENLPLLIFHKRYLALHEILGNI